MKNKAVIRKTHNGVYFVEIPATLVRIAKIKEGDTVEVMPGNAVTVKKDDLIVRKAP